ncbi:MAG: hypothetical protein NC926_05265 [Candidatus Omnitrophica bacterium]|nr:hypothetical protein [Candidatus Omnitrophota bacterium]MCM8807346.1 hypothetical protein [Candidatus Omnitrophota bacterium]
MVKRKGRRILWIDTEIQLRFVIFTIISLAISCFIVSSLTFNNIWLGIFEKFLKIENSEILYSSSVKKFIFLNFFIIILLALLASLGMIILSHKVAGPAYRIKKMLQELQEGKFPEFKLRKGDTLTSLVEELEKFSKKYKELNDIAIKVIEAWKNTEIKDISLNIALKELEDKIFHLSIKKEGVKNEERI